MDDPKPRHLITGLRIATAVVWLVFGVVFKIFDLVPRHRAIVATIVGDGIARPVTMVIGAAESLMALWILSRRRPRTCAAVQTVAIVAMNTLELRLGKDHLLAPIPMLCANAIFLAVGWYCALNVQPVAREP